MKCLIPAEYSLHSWPAIFVPPASLISSIYFMWHLPCSWNGQPQIFCCSCCIALRSAGDGAQNRSPTPVLVWVSATFWRERNGISAQLTSFHVAVKCKCHAHFCNSHDIFVPSWHFFPKHWWSAHERSAKTVLEVVLFLADLKGMINWHKVKEHLRMWNVWPIKEIPWLASSGKSSCADQWMPAVLINERWICQLLRERFKISWKK